MTQVNKFFLLLFLFLLLTTFNANNSKNYKSFFFQIKEINVENTFAINSLILKKDLNFLINTSLLFLDKKKIKEKTSKYEFISVIKMKKIFPNKLTVQVLEKKPIAIQIIGNKKFYITNQGENLIYFDFKGYEKLPIIFGNQRNFHLFFKEIKNSSFPIEKIKTFYYFDIGRWDIELKNKKIIKFPEKNYKKIFEKISLILNDINFEKYKIFDYRIKDQLILQ